MKIFRVAAWNSIRKHEEFFWVKLPKWSEEFEQKLRAKGLTKLAHLEENVLTEQQAIDNIKMVSEPIVSLPEEKEKYYGEN